MADIQNPFHTQLAIENSNYNSVADGRLVRPETGDRPAPLTALVHDELRALVLSEHFSCVGARSALRHGAYRFGLYGDLGTESASAGLARDLYTFSQEMNGEESFTTYLASFSGPVPLDETEFERLLWQTLQQLHDLDVVHHAWDRSVADNPSDPHFSFSFGEVAYFVVGLHAASSRAARRFAWPTLVFNPHRQFEALRAEGRFERFQDVIRQADEALQGDINPVLAVHGEQSDARQYSGRAVEPDWQCPFHAHSVAKQN